MSVRELQRVEVMARVAKGDLAIVDAATILGLSYRQTKRVWRQYRRKGAQGLQHRSAGRRSNRASAPGIRRRALALIRRKYGGDAATRFGPTLAAEHLAEEDAVAVHPETLRRWMLAEGLWSRAREAAAHRSRRVRKAHVERHHGTHQDRLVKKLRRQGATTYAAANTYLETTYTADHNRRFAIAPAAPEHFHLAVPRGLSLDRVFRLQEDRTISNDWVVRYDNRFLQLTRQSGYPPARSLVHVCEAADGHLEIRYRDRVMAW